MGRFETLQLGSRRVDVYLPSDRTRSPRPVLVMHDGHNVFFPELSSFGGVWQADQAVESLDFSGPKPIVAAVWHLKDQRESEYLPQDVITAHPQMRKDHLPGVDYSRLRGNAYIRTLRNRVLPAVSELAKIRTDAAGIGVMGASAGAWASLYALAKHPESFGTAMCLSMPWGWAASEFIEEFVNLVPDPKSGARIWHDHGTTDLDRSYGVFRARADARLTKAGWRWPALVSNAYVGHGHNEAAWAARLPEILQWWLRGMPNPH